MGLLSGCGVGQITLLGPDRGTDTERPGDTEDTDAERTCDEAPELTRDQALQLGWEEEELWLVCAGDGESCQDPQEMNLYAFLTEALGQHPDPELCSWYGTVECGPEQAIPDSCCYLMTVGQICEGRPLVIDGERRRAVQGEGPWARAAADEQAAIASFARHALELMALGAPPELVGQVAVAMADEVLHASLCADLAGVKLGPLDATEAVPVEPAAVLSSLIREGCINETIAATIAAEAALQATGKEREVLDRLAVDEQRHSTLAWKTLAWMLQRFPELRAVAVRDFARPVEVGDDSAYGLLTGPDKLRVAQRVMAQVVHPCAARLLKTRRQDVVAS